MKTLSSIKDIQDLEVTFISTTNPLFQHMENEEGSLSYENSLLLFDNHKRNQTFYTTYIKSIVIEDNILTANTRNLIYEFKFIDNVNDAAFIVDK